MKIKKCLNCNKEYETKNVSFCSRKCYWNSKKGNYPHATVMKGHTPWNKGKTGFKHSEETKKKISIGLKGRYVSQETKDKIAETLRRRKGGITDELIILRKSEDYKKWRMDVYQRDWFTCQECGKHSNIVAHHINSFRHFPDLRFELSNGKTLCRTCHINTHREELIKA